MAAAQCVSRIVGAQYANAALVERAYPWCAAGTVPTGERLNVAISPQLEDSFKVLDDSESNNN